MNLLLSSTYLTPQKHTQKTPLPQHTKKLNASAPPPTQRVTYLEHKYSSRTSGRSDRGQEDTRGRCRTHFQPAEARDGGGWGEGRGREPGSDAPSGPSRTSSSPTHVTSHLRFPAQCKSLKKEATVVTTRTFCRDPVPGIYYGVF